MATEYVIRNTQERPDRSGVVRPYLTRMFNGRQYPVAFTEKQLTDVEALGEPEPVPPDLETVSATAQDTHSLLEGLRHEQQKTNELLARIASSLDNYGRERNRPHPSRWQRIKLRLR